MIEEKILALGIELPNAPQSAGSYVQVAITGNLVFVSGQLPVEPGSIPMQVKFKGKVGKDISLEQGQEAARLCTINALAQLKSTLGSLEKIKNFVKVSGFVNCDATFSSHPQIINGASDFILQIFGDKGRHSRSAIGAISLPLDSAVEIEFI
ncbi:MAG TPA: RidA family protein, partial [Nitrososphaeraceae archaeon]|nr:RidA family protein [Nitrososphaeraceae archaeon]